MPPNRKANVDVVVEGVASLQNLQNTVKYAPLSSQATPLTRTDTSNDAYWEWPVDASASHEEWKKATIQRILQEEEARQLLSAEHIQDNLTSPTPLDNSKPRPEHDAYWTWKVPVRPDSYWEWPQGDEKQRMIDQILEEERIRHLFSADHIVENIQRQPQPAVGQRRQEDSYWEW